MKLTELHVEGYRSLVNVTVPLRDLMVMIGPNGSGKTSLLEIFLLLKHTVDKQLTSYFESLGGLEAVLSRTANASERFKLNLSADVTSKDNTLITYSFEIASRGTGYVFLSEKLEDQDESGKAVVYLERKLDQIRYYDKTQKKLISASPVDSGSTQDTHESALPQLTVRDSGLRPVLFRSPLRQIELYHSLDTGQRAMVRLPQALIPAQRPGPNGESLYSALYNLRTEADDRYKQIEELLYIGFPGFQRLEFPVVGAGQVTMAWHQKGVTTPFYPNQLSEGMLRFLWLTTILLSPDTPSVILIDEPEVSLHPELLKLLAGLLQDASARSQILVATHSPDLIRWLKPEEVLITEKNENGETSFTWADTLSLQAWLEEYTLRDLWLMGTLGGRP